MKQEPKDYLIESLIIALHSTSVILTRFTPTVEAEMLLGPEITDNAHNLIKVSRSQLSVNEEVMGRAIARFPSPLIDMVLAATTPSQEQEVPHGAKH